MPYPVMRYGRVIGEVVGVTAKTVNAYAEKIRYLNGMSNPDFFRLLARVRQEAVGAYGRRPATAEPTPWSACASTTAR